MPQFESSYAILAPVALMAGFVRGFAGFGGPLVMLPVLSQYLPPAAAMWVMMWVDLAVNIRLLPEAQRAASRSVVLPLSLGTLLTMPLGVKFMAANDPLIIKRAISAAVLVAAIVLMTGWRYRGTVNALIWASVGALSGLVMGATSLAVTAALFLHADRRSAAESRANFIVWVFVASLALLALLLIQNALAPGYLEMIVVLTPLYLLGTLAGAHWQGRAPERLVRGLVLLLAACIGGVGIFL